MRESLRPQQAMLSRDNRYKLIKKRMRSNWDVYLMALPGIILLIVFKYLPMYGIIIAFKNFNIVKGVIGSDWIGLENFQRLTYSFEFKRAFRNTLLLSVVKMVFGMPVPIIFALLLNELRSLPYKRVTQTIVYVPHFISWVVVAGIFMDLLSPSTGIINRLIEAMGGKAIFFMTNSRYIRTLIVVTDIWKGFGWGTIIYLAAITGVDPELYSAAAIDGAGRFRQTIHVTLPAISSTFIILLIMRLGAIMSGANFEQIFMMYSPPVYEQIDILGTYVYRTALIRWTSAIHRRLGFSSRSSDAYCSCPPTHWPNGWAAGACTKKGGRLVKRTRGEKIFAVFNYFIVGLAAATCLLPFLHVLAKSFSDEISVLAKEIILWPKGFNTAAYQYVLGNPQYRRSMLNSLIITSAGTVIAMTITVMTAYVFTRKDLPGKMFIVMLFIITMFFGGGIIPTYILYSQMKLLDTYTVLILPGAIGVFNIILMRNFFDSLSTEMEESAKIDGASNMRVLFQIYLPLSKAALATIGLFFAVGRWNSFFDAVLYTTQREMMPIQLYLRNILANLDNMLEMDPEQLEYVCAEGVRSATIISAVLPILLVYPFIQKYFVKGIMIGAVKG